MARTNPLLSHLNRENYTHHKPLTLRHLMHLSYSLIISERTWVTDLYSYSRSLFSSHPQTTINDLPPEILEQIFIHCIHDIDDDASPTSPTLPKTFISAQSNRVVNPFILGQVCGRWMDISRSRPNLWSIIHIMEPTRKHMEMVSHWLSLSADSPLTFSLTIRKESASSGTDNSHPAASDSSRRYLDLLLSRYDEWQHVTIHLSHANYVASGFRERFPNYYPPKLKYADINYGHGMMGGGAADDAIIQLYSSPEMDSLSWSPQWYKPMSLPTKFPHWKDLKHLTYRQGYSENALTVNQAVGLLLGCPRLEHFDAIIHAEHGHVSDVNEPFIHPNIRVLDLKFHPDRSIHLFDSLSCPVLEKVSIDFVSVGCEGVMESADPFLCFLERSQCKLEIFSFNNKGGPEDVLLDILGSQQLKNIQALHLSGLRTSSAIDLLTEAGSGPSSFLILPRLERFEFKRYSYTREMPTEVIERMSKSRTKRKDQKHINLSLGDMGIRLASLVGREFDIRLPNFTEVLRGGRETMVSQER